MRKQEEDKDTPGIYWNTTISVAEGGGGKKEDNVERELKLKCPSETKVKPRAVNGRTPWGNARTLTSQHDRRGCYKIWLAQGSCPWGFLIWFS